MKILIFTTSETDFYPGNISQLTYLILENGKLRKGNSFVFKVEDIEEYFEEKYDLTKEQSYIFSAGDNFGDLLPLFKDDFLDSDSYITFNYLNNKKAFLFKEIVLWADAEEGNTIIGDINHHHMDMCFRSYDEEKINLDIEKVFEREVGKEYYKYVNILGKRLFNLDEEGLNKDLIKKEVIQLFLIFLKVVHTGKILVPIKMEVEVENFIDNFDYSMFLEEGYCG